MKRKEKVNRNWSGNLAYAIGLITSDGNVSKDGRHINLTSKDLQLIKHFKAALGVKNKVGRKGRGGSSKKIKKYYVVQIGDIAFCEFLLTIGVGQRKSKTISEVKVPDVYFGDFLRGCFDGDGSYGFTQHPESKNPQFKMRLYSASPTFLAWVKCRIAKLFGIAGGWIIDHPTTSVHELAYAAMDSKLILRYIYHPRAELYLTRKKLIADRLL